MITRLIVITVVYVFNFFSIPVDQNKWLFLLPQLKGSTDMGTEMPVLFSTMPMICGMGLCFLGSKDHTQACPRLAVN